MRLKTRYSRLKKKTAEINIVVSSRGVTVVLVSRKSVLKFLKRSRVFYARVVYSRYPNLEELYKAIQFWWDNEDEQTLIQTLADAPLGQRPFINYDSGKLRLDFNLDKFKNLDDFMDEEDLIYNE